MSGVNLPTTIKPPNSRYDDMEDLITGISIIVVGLLLYAIVDYFRHRMF